MYSGVVWPHGCFRLSARRYEFQTYNVALNIPLGDVDQETRVATIIQNVLDSNVLLLQGVCGETVLLDVSLISY